MKSTKKTREWAGIQAIERMLKGGLGLLLFFLLVAAPAVVIAQPDSEESKPPPATLIGHWILTLPTPNGLENPKLVVYQDGKMLRGKLIGKTGTVRLRKVEFYDPTFSFQQTMKIPSGELILKFTGTVRGDTLQGAVTSRLGKLPFAGTRKPE